jgi:hypothetical protein
VAVPGDRLRFMLVEPPEAVPPPQPASARAKGASAATSTRNLGWPFSLEVGVVNFKPRL